MPRGYPPILDKIGRGAPTRLLGLGGGCIADARMASFADGSRVFVKSSAGQADMFQREAEGLAALAAAAALRVPQVIAVDDQTLVLELIETGTKEKGFYEDFGRGFACLHQHRGRASGFAHDNFIGSNPQCNRPINGGWDDSDDADGREWPGFFLQRRLRYQTQLAMSRGHGDQPERLLDRAEPLIMKLLQAAVEAPSLLHGDLWGGNYLVDEQGQACLIDPAVYFGHREADLAMTRLFGGFDPSFYSAYEEVLPLQPGHEDRLPIYQLYHVLNHLNLFGGGYLTQSLSILQRYAD